MPVRLLIPGAVTTPVPTPPPSELLSGVDVGPLALWEPGHPDSGLSGVPGNGASLIDLAHDWAAATIGSEPGGLGVANSVASDSVKSKIERTAKGGLHFMNSRTVQASPYELFDLQFGSTRLGWINGHTDHDFYSSAWFAVTRTADASYTNPNAIFGLRKGDPNATAGDRWQTIGPITTTINVYPNSSGDARWIGSRTRRDGPGAGSYTFFGAVATNQSPTSFVALDRMIRLGAPSSGYVNKLPSVVVYRTYLEDLTASGRTFAEVQAIDEAEYVAEVLTAGGRYYGDTWSDPATVLP